MVEITAESSQEIHPTPENSFEGNRVKDNFEIES